MPQESWKKSRIPNLFIKLPSGVYYAKVKVRGKLKKRSLKTDDYGQAARALPEVLDDLIQTVRLVSCMCGCSLASVFDLCSILCLSISSMSENHQFCASSFNQRLKPTLILASELFQQKAEEQPCMASPFDTCFSHGYHIPQDNMALTDYCVLVLDGDLVVVSS